MSVRECGFCGATENLMHMNCVPDRYGKYDFCKDNKVCEEAYGQYVYSKDITYGIPAFLSKQSIASDDRCHYCGCKENLVNVPCKSYDYHSLNQTKYSLNFNFQAFCKNDKCLKRYINYINTKSTGIPFIILDKLECICKVATSDCLCRDIDLQIGRCRC
jgi:hypothetical protein